MDWIKTGWGKEFSDSFRSDVSLYMDFSGLRRTSNQVLSVSNEVINHITKTHKPPYYLFVSGGIDSQAMLWCWINSSVPFTAINIRYFSQDTDFNEHDRTQLIEFSEKNELVFKTLDFDVVSFLETNLVEYASKYYCTSPQICTHMKMSELIDDGTVIFSGDFADFATYTYTILGLKRYADITKRSMIPFFFLHDPKLAGCVKKVNRLTYIQDLNAADHRFDMYNDKIQSYLESGIPVIPQHSKYTGFEKLKEFYDNQQDRITSIERLKYSKLNYPSRRVFDILFRYRLRDIIKYQDKIIYQDINK